MQKQDYAWLTVRVPVETHASVKEQAGRVGISISDYLRMMLSDNVLIVDGNTTAENHNRAVRQDISAIVA